MLPDGSGAGRGGAGAEPAVEAPEAPTFSLDELNECIGEKLGGGVFGDVYSLRGFPRLAVKEIYLSGQSDRLKEITKFELEALSRFSHSGVLKYHRVIKDDDFLYIIMDRYDGDLQRFVTDYRRTQKPIPRELMFSILRQLADALAYVHDSTKTDASANTLPAIVHRNLKPANILMNKDGERVVIADFGLCKDAQHDGRTIAGTPAYMAPETLLYNSTSPASDIWALGVIVYELTTLRKPNFLGDKEPRHVFTSGWRPDLSAIKDDSVREILEGIFVLDPKKWPTARDLCELLQVSDTSVVGMRLRSMMLEEALNKANARIAALERELQTKSSDSSTLKSTIAAQAAEVDSLEKDLKGKSTKIETLEKQYKNLSKIVEQHQKQFAKANEDLKQQITQEPKAIPNPSSPKAIKQNQACKGDAVQQYSSTLPQSSWTPLMRAAATGDIKTARNHLPKNGKKSASGDAALILAARAGHANIVELLDPTDKNGVTALMRAADRNDVEAVTALMPLQKGKKATGGVTINGWKIYGGTALMMAAVCGHAEVMMLLAEREGGLQENDGWTTLMYAAEHGHADCVKILLEREGGKQDSIGETALMKAARASRLDCAELLLKKEGGVQDKNGWTALMWAADKGHPDCVRLLLEREGGMQHKDGWTALMSAADKGHADCVRLLLEREGGMQNNDGETACAIAKRRGHSSVADLLAKYE